MFENLRETTTTSNILHPLQTFLSVRDGFWVMSRMAHRGQPVDMALISRFNILLLQLLPKTLINWAGERALNQKYDHELYGLKPRHRYHCLNQPTSFDYCSKTKGAEFNADKLA